MRTTGKKATIALGVFDGVHLGHQQIIRKALDVAGDSDVYICAFRPNPLKILSKKSAPKALMSCEDIHEIIEQEFHAQYYELTFNHQIANMDGQEYIEHLLTIFDLTNIVVGFNYHFGKGAQYNTQDLAQLCEERGIGCHVVGEYQYQGQTISSTRIRGLLDEGDIETASLLLGRRYKVCGTVVKGKGIGNQIDFATANIPVHPDIQYPAKGVYITRTWLDDQWQPSMTNIGFNPTVSTLDSMVMETHILGHNQSMYGQRIIVEFLHRLRDELSFDGIEALKTQLVNDRNQVIAYFQEHPNGK